MFRKGFLASTSWTVNGDGFAIGNNAEGADFLAKILYTIVGDGAAAVTTTGFQVVKKTGLTCTVKPFFVAKSGYFAWDAAETDITFTSSTSEQVIYVGVRLDLPNNTFVDAVAGRTTFISATDLVSAKITIPANAVTLTDGMIEDLRYNTTYCGQIDEYRERALAVLAKLEAALETVIAGGIPNHASMHEQDGDDPLTGYLATFAMLNAGGIFTGGAVTAQGTPDQTVAVSAGSLVTPQGKRYAFGAVSALAASAADATNPRIDIVYITSAGAVTYLAGTAAASPAQPSTPANGTVLVAIARAANDNTIATGDITDQRDFITTANDFEDVTYVSESSNVFTCDFAKKHTKNFACSTVANTTAKTVNFTNVPFGTCDTIVSIRATSTAAFTWTLDGRTLVWPAGAPTLTAGYTYEILISWNALLGKWIGRAQIGAAN